jgi:hypothetical protein
MNTHLDSGLSDMHRNAFTHFFRFWRPVHAQYQPKRAPSSPSDLPRLKLVIHVVFTSRRFLSQKANPMNDFVAVSYKRTGLTAQKFKKIQEVSDK